MISIIIPTLNEAIALTHTLRSLQQLRGEWEIIIVDGGSTDRTVEICCAQGIPVLTGSCGRGVQMHLGAGVARGEILWFLHADTLPPADALEQIARALQSATVVGGNFQIEFTGSHWSARFLTWLYPQLRRIGLFYGDSAIFVRRTAYEQAGGFQAFPIFEDLDLVRRLKRQGQMIQLPTRVITSSRRFEGRSFLLTFIRWTILQVLFWVGVSPLRLGLYYAPIRSSRRKPEPSA